jgi:predicted neuraminidase
MKLPCLVAFAAVVFQVATLWAGRPVFESEPVFPPEARHNHASCIVEAPDGSLFVAWFNGTGERQADDVKILGAMRKRGAKQWSPRFTLLDTPGFPDCNPSLHVDGRGRLWLFNPTIVANTWESALLKVHVSSDWRRKTPPVWERGDVILLAPGPEFERTVASALPRLEAELARSELTPRQRREVAEFVEASRSNVTNRFYRRMGWMPRAHLTVADGRWLLPLYHDGFSFSLIAISDDQGETWRPSAPVVGAGNVQPSIVRRRDGTLVAWMRDNGPPPQRLLLSRSTDRGETWSPAEDSEIPNPGSGAEVVVLRDGLWAFIGNDTESGRHSLALWLSNDEGVSWKWRRHLEQANPGAGSFGYPSLIETRDGFLHATWTEQRGEMKTIRHARFNREWVGR